MIMDNFASIIENLKQEITDLRKQKDELLRLASFPQQDPTAIFEFNQLGEMVYQNQAAHDLLAELNQADEKLILPESFSEIYIDAKEKSVIQSFKEIRINGQVFEESVVYSQEYDTIRIYAEDITRRVQIEEALNTSKFELMQMQEFLEAATKGVGVIIATVDKDMRYTYFNQAYQEELKHLTGKDIHIGMNILEPFADFPDQRKVVEEEWNQVLNGESTNKTLEFGDPGLYRRTYTVLHTPIRDANGKVVGAGEVAYNITQQLRTESALRESEERYHSLFSSMTEGFAIHEMLFDETGEPSDYRFLDINPAFERLTGLNREKVIGKTYHQVLPEESDRWVDIYGKVMLTGKPIQFEEYSPSLHKYYEVFAYRYAPQQFATIFQDITDRKHVDNDLRVNLTKYRVLFDALPLGVTITDQDGHIVESNQEATTILGVSVDEQKNRLIHGSELKIIRPDGTPMPSEEFASVRALKERRRIENIEMGVVKENNKIAWISATAEPLPLENYGVVITYNDITRRIQAEDALRKVHERLEFTVQQRTQELLNANDELRVEIEERKRVESELVVQTKAVEAQRQRFNAVLEILPAYLILLTPDYHVAFANRYFRERFGEDHGRPCFEYLFNRSSPCENCETFKALHTGESHNWGWTGPDGRNYDVYDFPFTDVDGSTLILEMGIDITGRKQAEEKLRALNTYNRSLLEANLDALVTITPDGRIGDVNTVTETITGYSRNDLIGTAFHAYFTDPEKARAGYEQVFETGLVRDYELEIQHNDGHTTPVVYNASVYRDEAGSVIGVFAAARDISERKQAEKQLILLTTALESAANGIILTDRDGTVLWSNPAFNRMTGYSTEEIIGKNPRFLKSGKQSLEFYKNLWDTIRAGQVWRGELINRRKDGSFYNEEQTITPVFDKSGVITNFISIKQDITEHKQAEEALMKSEQQYRSLVSATSQIVWQTNAMGEVIEDIPLWREFTGQCVDELLNYGWLNALHPDDRARVAVIWNDAVKTSSSYDTEYRVRSVSGEYYDFAVRGVPIIDKDGNTISWVGTCNNITEKKRVENQLLQAEKHAVIGRMVGSVTHEINNPLQTIKNCLYLIQQDTSSDSIIREPLEMAASETQRLSNLVGQLRQLYRSQTIQTMLPQPLLEIISEVRPLLASQLNEANVSWQLTPGLQPCMVNCVKDQLIEVLLNISMNAIEAMKPSGGTLSIDMDYPQDGTQVGIIITDTGPGISADILPHIFEPFITTKEYGLGLGLPICFGIIQKHGGQITVDSHPGQGTSFTVWLPLVSNPMEEE